MECANTKALNRFQEKQKQQEVCYEAFLKHIDEDLVEIQEMIEKLQKVAKDYDVYDYSEDLKEHLEDLI